MFLSRYILHRAERNKATKDDLEASTKLKCTMKDQMVAGLMLQTSFEYNALMIAMIER